MDPAVGNDDLELGDIVVARHPFDTSVTLIKRFVERLESRLQLLGDNPQSSSDSRSFGALDPSLLLGKVIAKLPA